MRDEMLIKNLSRELTPRMSIVPFQRPLLAWLIFTFLVVGSGVVMHSMRTDLVVLIERRSFLFEMASALSFALIAAGSALHLRIPGTKAPKKVLAAVGLLWLGAVIVHATAMGPMVWGFDTHNELSCMAMVFALGALPGVALYALVRRGACTQPQLTAGLIAMAMTASAAAFLPMACGNDGLIHLLFGHVLPLVVATVVLWFAGSRLLRW